MTPQQIEEKARATIAAAMVRNADNLRRSLRAITGYTLGSRPNPLYAQMRRAEHAGTGRGAEEHQREHRALLDSWGTSNGLVRSREFPIGQLIRAGTHARKADQRPMWALWSGRRTPTCFRRGGVAMAMVLEPYGDGFEEVRLHQFAEEHRLALHTPSHPLASFWYPGRSLFIVMTRADFGEVQWTTPQWGFVPRPTPTRLDATP